MLIFVKQPYGIKIRITANISRVVFLKQTSLRNALYTKDEQGKQSLVTEFDQNKAREFYHLQKL